MYKTPLIKRNIKFSQNTPSYSPFRPPSPPTSPPPLLSPPSLPSLSPPLFPPPLFPHHLFLPPPILLFFLLPLSPFKQTQQTNYLPLPLLPPLSPLKQNKTN